MKEVHLLLGIILVIAIIATALISVEARRSESCQCFYVGECKYTEDGFPYRYYMCRGSCATYSEYRADLRCKMPAPKINEN